MEHDPFGNLREWGTVLQTLKDLGSSNRLAECQKGLIRILRFRENWRLREEVLKCIGKINAPSARLIEQVIEMVCDEDAYYELRILASRTLGELMRNHCKQPHDGNSPRTEAALERMYSLLQVPQPPILSEALHRCLRDVQETSGIARN